MIIASKHLEVVTTGPESVGCKSQLAYGLWSKSKASGWYSRCFGVFLLKVSIKYCIIRLKDILEVDKDERKMGSYL